MKNAVYAFDSTTIDHCLAVFPSAKFRKTKAAVKLHTLLDPRGSIPVVISITNGKSSDVNALDDLVFEPGAIYIFDRGYIDFARLYRGSGVNRVGLPERSGYPIYEIFSCKNLTLGCFLL